MDLINQHVTGLHPFLKNRTQKVRIGQTLSEAITLKSGVPQGGILSPILFTLFTADLEKWCKHSKIYGYADDTTSSCKGKSWKDIIKNLEEDANIILSYMASNGLAANQNKTVFMLLNMKKHAAKNQEEEQEEELSIKVGNSLVKRSCSTNLLGVTIEENQGWKEHFNNTINALNKRTFAIRRIAAQIPHKNIIKVVQSLWMSKLRYGLQLCNRVRLTENDPKNTSMMARQVAQ